ncbi:hypothetical protein SBA4_2440010 [Candidatus Sulfopaludibacter sp. SbA4]|nr:hypothetical protein SBA4_2440010 [Candidatus Sulfopaludibacter sp. SbA4]
MQSRLTSGRRLLSGPGGDVRARQGRADRMGRRAVEKELQNASLPILSHFSIRDRAATVRPFAAVSWLTPAWPAATRLAYS